LTASPVEKLPQKEGNTLRQASLAWEMRLAEDKVGVALWFRITKGWLAYHDDFLPNETLPNDEERKLLGALIAISTGVEDVAKLNVPAEVGRRLLECYDDPAGNQRWEE
jgi:hypothetical protein